ncbi:MAG: PAS domain-containing sensor histidine kinase [Chitinispirillaceae bacterium]
MSKPHRQSLSKDEQIRQLQVRLADAEANLEAIRRGEADAIVVQTENGISAFTIQGAETAYRIMVETMSEGALTLDPRGVILYVNTRFATMLGISASLLVGTLMRDLIAEHQVQDFELFFRKTQAGSNVYQDFELIKRDLSVLPVSMASAPLQILGRHDICIVVGDLTERQNARRKLIELNNSLEQKVAQRTRELEKQKAQLEANREELHQLASSLEHQVGHRTAQVRDLAKALALAEQKQRQRLSFILHEDLQQVLFATVTRFDMLRDTIRDGSHEEVAEDVEALEKLVSKAVVTSRRLAIELNPPILPGEGIDAALRWLAHHFEKQYGLVVSVSIAQGLHVILPEERILLVQLVQELLLNVVKHAEAGVAALSVSSDNEHIFLTVEDKGVGFDLDAEQAIARGRTHMGLFSIEERLRLFGGSIRIHTAPGKGTRITIKMPFNSKLQQFGVE